jgi:hypothetical protein
VQTSVASAHPPTLVILGVDASGKNHIANLAADLLAARGHPAAKRSGWLAAHPREVASSQDEGRVRRLEEWLFVTAYPLHRVLLPRLVDLAVRADLRLANRLGRRVGPGTILISHTPVRVLAFHVGHGGSIPGYLDARLRRLGERAGGCGGGAGHRPRDPPRPGGGPRRPRPPGPRGPLPHPTRPRGAERADRGQPPLPGADVPGATVISNDTSPTTNWPPCSGRFSTAPIPPK